MRLRKHRNTSTGVLREKNYFHRDTVQDSEQPKLLSSDAAKPDRATFLAHIEYGITLLSLMTYLLYWYSV